MNMGELEKMSEMIRQTMARLPSAAAPLTQSAPSFGHQTHKTDLQKQILSQEIKEFREEHLTKSKPVDNPFSYDEDLTRHDDLPAKQHSPQFKEELMPIKEESKNANEETVFSIEEMERIERILKQ